MLLEHPSGRPGSAEDDLRICTKSSRPPPQKPDSVLVYVGLDRTGDGLIKLPFVYALRRSFPEARITWLAGKGESVFAREMNAFVRGALDEVVENAGVGSRFSELLGPRPLAGRGFDLVIDTQRRLLTTLIVRRIRHGAFVSGTANFLLSDVQPQGPDRPRSVAMQLAELLELAGGLPPQGACGAAADPDSESLAARLLPAGPAYVGFAPGAGKAEKCWPLARYVEVARAEAEAGRVPVFLLGPMDVALAGEIRAALPRALLPLQEAAAITPALTIALGRRLVAAVANDCGAGHLLAASGVPLVSLFGPTSAEKFAPAAARLAVLRAQDWGGRAMEAIPAVAVVKALEDAIGRSPAGSPA